MNAGFFVSNSSLISTAADRVLKLCDPFSSDLSTRLNVSLFGQHLTPNQPLMFVSDLFGCSK
ncbi:hypothetical protein A9Q83_01385 [Alphaproteobacteria bacterium 46_93_T64]|nr:hypothetical protein A9Q83_01385 [Alphaproteobacteria bacterium 46_93_T64]